MKKSLLAVAAIGAFASAAQAQSSVTVYGILDVGYNGSNSSVKQTTTGSSYPTTLTSPQNTIQKNTGQSFGQSGETTSRLGFKGTEDLGGGTSAFFTVEFGLFPQEQDVSGTSQAGLRNRQTFVGLKKNGLGDFAVGTQYTPVHVAVAATDAGGQNNQTGNVIYTGQGDGFAVNGASGANAGAYQSRYSNALTLNTEKMGGFQAHAMAVLNNANATVSTQGTNGTTAAGGKTNTTGAVVGVDYSIGKAFLTANYSQMKQITDTRGCAADAVNGDTAPTAGSCSFAIFGQGTAASIPYGSAKVGSSPMNVIDTTQYYAGSYDFGMLKAYVQYINRKAVSPELSSASQTRIAQQIGVNSYITPTIQAWASAGVGKFTPYGTGQAASNFNAWQLGSNYYLSKRTNLYGIYGQFAQAQGNFNTTLAGGTQGQYSNNSNSYAVGVRHTF